MKFLSLLLIIPFLSFSQEIGDLKAEMAKLESVPQAPEAYTFKEYGNNNINLNLGIPDISVEVYTHQGKEMKLPITLNYDASGVKVSETASWVGLKWNLNYGGRIDRIVNGLADEKTRSGYRTLRDQEVRSKFFTFFDNESPNNFFRNQFENITLAREALEFLQDIKDGCIDTQPDYFKMSALGESEHMVLDYKNNFKPIGIDNHRLKVSVLEDTQNQIKSWTVILDNGILLEFKKYEEIETEGFDTVNMCNVINSYYTSWMLTKIISANGKDTYRFYYSDFQLNNPQYLNESVLAINKYFANTTSENWNDMAIIGETPGQFKRKQSILDSISYNSKTFLKTNLQSRLDLVDVNNALESISLVDRKNNQIKKVKFLYSYFGNTQNSKMQSIRLKLDGLKIFNKTNSDYKSYSFSYIQPERIPSINSKSRDLWGFNNGIPSTNYIFYMM